MSGATGYTIAGVTGGVRRAGELYLPPPAAVRSAPSVRLSTANLDAIRHRDVINSCKLAAGAFAVVAATLAIMVYQADKQDATDIAPGRNQTIVFRQEARTYSLLERMEPFIDQAGDAAAVPSNYALVVRTVRFLNPDASQTLAATGGRLPQVKLNGRTYGPAANPMYRAEGVASWYGPDFHGGRTANGERYDMNGISAAHRTMPLPSYARVTNLDNGRSIIVRVNNRGPYVHDRIVDLSVGTAKALDFYRRGTAHVRVEYVGRAPVEGSDDQMLLATLRAGTPAPVPASVMVASAKASLPN
jgi:rare lipoprotein A (peptidoglycan hydrolase)